ncbi:MAG: decaprenyl-phosphate phosphoribosyltransferase [Fibrobacterota bacterium]
MKAVLKSLRLDQWLKNAFVLAPLVFARHLFEPRLLLTAIAYTFAFCLASSAVYLINDIFDREHDRAHPDKKHRPLASGEMGVGLATVLAAALAAVSIGTGLSMDPAAGLIMALYLANNLLYSLYLKRVVVLDVVLIAAGFVLRVLGGASVIHVQPSVWLIMCTFLLSLFLGFCKRKQERLALKGHAPEHRAVLDDYALNYLDHMISVVSACTIISYALYTVADATVAKFHTERLIYTLPFVLYGVFRYVYHVNVLQSRKSTSHILFHDKSLILDLLLWFAVTAAIIYF